MPTIGRRRFTGFLVRGAAIAAALSANAAEQETPFSRLAKLATYLSENSVPEALACFDPKMKDYATIEADIEALGAQTDVLCAIDVVEEKVVEEEKPALHKKGEGGWRKLDTDWFVELRSQADGGPVERRRERVQIEMKQSSNAWKIVAMAPVSILAPIHIQ